MNTCEVIHQWREKAVLLFIPRDIWPSVWFVTICWTLHITTSPHHCAANHAVDCKIPTELTRCGPHEHYQMKLFCVTWNSVLIAMHELLQWITFNIQPIWNIFKWIKSNKFCNMNSYSLIGQYVTRFDEFFFIKFKLFWDKQQMINKYVAHYYFNKMYSVACFLMKMINQ